MSRCSPQYIGNLLRNHNAFRTCAYPQSTYLCKRGPLAPLQHHHRGDRALRHRDHGRDAQRRQCRGYALLNCLHHNRPTTIQIAALLKYMYNVSWCKFWFCANIIMRLLLWYPFRYLLWFLFVKFGIRKLNYRQ